MKTICIDAGNTLVKVAFMEDGAVRSLASYPVDDACDLLNGIALLPRADACILSSVSIAGREVTDALSQKASYFLELTAQTPIPIRNLYKTPETLGKDRLAAAVGAYGLFPGKDILVLDAGTALTIDFIDRAGNYRGGNISPGLNMRFHALHDHTKKLPLQTQTDDYLLLGDTTVSAIISGVQNGIIFEIDCYMNHFVKQYPELVTILTGGDVIFFANKIEKHIFAEPNLVFIGLEKIIEFNF
ncbi:MAG: type III pantothenate kinase [Bacteroidales bacterium]|nr:type III pantothenate kinase [Bacteroidales bacterium]